MNNYYWARLHVQLGEAQTRSAIYHFGNGDVGALVNVSGAAVMKSSQNQEAGQKLSRLSGERARAGADGEEPCRLRVSAACGRGAGSAAQAVRPVEPAAR